MNLHRPVETDWVTSLHVGSQELPERLTYGQIGRVSFGFVDLEWAYSSIVQINLILKFVMDSSQG